MKTYNPPWECSAAFEQHYGELRNEVAHLLYEWGSHRNSEWPEAARFIRISEVEPSVNWFTQIIQLGRRGIERQIPGWKLQELFPNHDWPGYTLDVYFVVHIEGNVNRGVRPRALTAYIVHPLTIKIVELGCDHPNRTQKKAGQQYTQYDCPDCGYKWGVDTTG